MKPTDQHPELRTMVRTLRIIVPLLALGVGGFLGYVHFGLGEPTVTREVPLITYIAASVAVLNFIAFAVVRGGMVRRARDEYARGNVQGFCVRYQTATIVWSAGLEAAGLFAAVAYLLEREPLALGVGLAMIVLLLASIPTRARVDALLETVS